MNREARARFRKVVLKLSGEALAGAQERGIDLDFLDSLASELGEVTRLGVQMTVVVGGGNIWRGAEGSARGMDRATSDYMGMLATVINSLALQDALERAGLETRLQTAIEMREVAEPYIRRRAMRHLEKGRVVIFAAGTGNPYFSTDTTAALRAAEIGADVLLMAKKGTDGIYDSDPRLHPDARKFDHLSYLDILNQGLRVMDATAASLCMENRMPIIVFDVGKRGNIRRVIEGEHIGTFVGGESDARGSLPGNRREDEENL